MSLKVVGCVFNKGALVGYTLSDGKRYTLTDIAKYLRAGGRIVGLALSDGCVVGADGIDLNYLLKDELFENKLHLPVHVPSVLNPSPLWPKNLYKVIFRYVLDKVDKLPNDVDETLGAILKQVPEAHEVLLLLFKFGLTREQVSVKLNIPCIEVTRLRSKAMTRLNSIQNREVLQYGISGYMKMKTNKEEKEASAAQLTGDSRTSLYALMQHGFLSVRCYNSLSRAGYVLLSDLNGVSVRSLVKVRNLGRQSLDEIIKVAGKYGVQLSS